MAPAADLVAVGSSDEASSSYSSSSSSDSEESPRQRPQRVKPLPTEEGKAATQRVQAPIKSALGSAAATAGSTSGGRLANPALRARQVGLKRRASSSSSNSSSSSSSDSSSESDEEESDLSGEEAVDVEVGESFTPRDLKDLAQAKALVPKQSHDPAYRGDWTGAPPPGTPGFNQFATKVMTAAAVGKGGSSGSGSCPPLQPHQESVAFLLHPRSPVTRLLVDHPTGSGKTREMIEVLNNFFFDPRPKIPIFPKEMVCRNFYAELLRWPNRYRDFFATLKPQDAARASGTADWRSRRGELWNLSELPNSVVKELCLSIRDVLEMKGWFFMGKMRSGRLAAFQERFPLEAVPGAPLRALRYTSAGGRHTELRGDGLPVSALLKVGFQREPGGGNVYSNKVVVMDEVHNLVRVQTQYSAQLVRLRELLLAAKGMVLAGFTGTPILNEIKEGRQLLDVIKGRFAPKCDAGFLSSFSLRPPELFPTSLPHGVPDGILTPKLQRQLVRKFVMRGEQLKRYDVKRRKGVPDRRLRAYCSLSVHFGSLHEGRSGSKARVLADMPNCAPKLSLVAQDILQRPEKTLVLVTRSSGLEALLEHLLSAAGGKFGVATMEELAEFNAPSNLHGQRFRVMLADAAQCSEGVSFISVRRVHLVDVPISPSAFVQSVGRAIRMYSHNSLPPEARTVTTTLWVAQMPRWMRSSLGAWAFRAQRTRAEPKEMETRAKKLLRHLLAIGVKDLQSLKDKIGTPAVPGKDHPQAQLSLTEVVSKLEMLGLWEEARQLRQRDQQRKQSKRRAVPGKTAAFRTVPKEATSRQDSSKADAKAAPSTSAKKGSSGKAPKVSKVTTPAAELPQPPQHKGNKHLMPWQRDPLARALQELYSAPTAAVAVIEMHLSPRSADEEAIRDLAQRSKMFVPALAELRTNAIDAEILQTLAAQQTQDPGSAGESSDLEFCVSDDSCGETGQPAGAPPLVLPPGWRTETFKRRTRECREFVDPQGRRYRTAAEARVAIDGLRRRENMSRQLQEAYSKSIMTKARLANEMQESRVSCVPLMA